MLRIRKSLTEFKTSVIDACLSVVSNDALLLESVIVICEIFLFLINIIGQFWRRNFVYFLSCQSFMYTIQSLHTHLALYVGRQPEGCNLPIQIMKVTPFWLSSQNM